MRYEYTTESTQPTLIARPSVIPGREQQTKIDYNAAGQITKVTETGYSPALDKAPATAIERSTTYGYSTINGRSLLTQIDGPFKNGKSNSPADSDITQLKYDGRGNYLKEVVYPMNLSAKLEYDEAGRTSKVIGVDGIVTQTSYNTKNQVVAIQRYPAKLSMQAAKEAGLLLTTSTLYDALGRNTQSTRADGQSIKLDDAAKYPQPVVVPDSHLSDQNRAQDSIAKAEIDDQELPAPTLQASFGPAGTLAQNHVIKFEANGKIAQRSIDDFGRVVAIQNPGQNWQTASYDAANRLIQITDPRGARTLASYDLADRLLEAQRFVASNTQAEESIRLTWTGANKTEETVFNGKNITHRTQYSYTVWGQLASQRVIITPLEKDQPSISLSQEMHYNEMGKLLSRTLPDGTRLAYRYYAEATGQPQVGGQIAAIEQIRWPKALDWLMTRLPESWQPKTLLAKFEPSLTEAVSSADSDSPVSSLTQDRADVETFAEPGLSENAPGAQFDAAGLPQRLTTAKGELQLLWNSAGRLAQVKDTSGKLIATYSYDARGRRASKSTAQGSEFYLYEGTQLIATATQSNDKGKPQTQITGQYIYQAYRPVAWLKPQLAESWWQKTKAWLGWSYTPAYALETDHRGAVLSVTTLDVDLTKRQTLWQSNINAWGAVKASEKKYT